MGARNLHSARACETTMRTPASTLSAVLALSAALSLAPREAAAQGTPGSPMTPLPGNPGRPLGPVLFPMAGGLRTQPVLDAPPFPYEEADALPPPGMRVRYKYNVKEILTGAAILSLAYTGTTIATSGVATTLVGAFAAPVGYLPVVGAYPMAGVAAALEAGPGTVAGFVALGVAQSIGFGLLIHGLATRQRIGIVPKCAGVSREEGLVLSPMVGAGFGGLSIGGAL